MKKIIMVLVLVLVLSLTLVYAAEESKFSGLVILKNDWLFVDGKNYSIQTFSPYLSYKRWGVGFDLRRYCGENKFFEFQPYLTYNIAGPWYLFGGFSIDTEDREFVQTGFWYTNQFGKLSLAADIRQWWAVSGQENKSFFDPFVQLLHPLPKPFNTNDKKFYGGVELEYIHWWQSSPHNWCMIGPIVGYNLNKNISLFMRYSSEWDVAEKTSRADRIRLGINFKF